MQNCPQIDLTTKCFDYEVPGVDPRGVQRPAPASEKNTKIFFLNHENFSRLLSPKVPLIRPGIQWVV